MTSMLNRRILVIDDQRAIHDAFRTVLQPEKGGQAKIDVLENALFGESVSAAEDAIEFDLKCVNQGQLGCDLLRQGLASGNPFAVAFVDMRMPPGWDGLETIKQLWKIDPQLQIVICTAYSDYTLEEICRELGNTDRLLLLKKPFANEEVQQLATALTEKWRLAKSLNSQLESLQQTNARLRGEIVTRQKAENRLRRMALTDGLTELPNRVLLTERLEECIIRRRQLEGGVDAVLFLDIDNFKLINDSLGHSEGDNLLVQVSERLLQNRRETDIVSPSPDALTARLGGDEFVILCQDLKSPAEAEAIAGRLNSALHHPFQLADRTMTIGVSIGIAVIDKDAVNAEEVLRNADTAMYQAKLGGKNRYSVFDKKMHAAVLTRLDLESQIRVALQQNEFELRFQPIVNLDTLQTAGFEALLRWRTSDGTYVLPDQFIPIAEETGLIVPIGNWVLEQSCATLAEWNATLPPELQLTMGVNVSKRQLVEGEFIEDVKQILERTGADGSKLHIEVTESTIMSQPEIIVQKLNDLRQLGILIHMDDFGTGHSSLSCLHKFPIDVLKIDRSFVATMETNSDYGAIIEAIIVLAHNLRTEVIAEGIETSSQLTRLQTLGCDFAQGYHFSRPLLKAEVVLPTPSAALPVNLPVLPVESNSSSPAT